MAANVKGICVPALCSWHEEHHHDAHDGGHMGMMPTACHTHQAKWVCKHSFQESPFHPIS